MYKYNIVVIITNCNMSVFIFHMSYRMSNPPFYNIKSY